MRKSDIVDSIYQQAGLMKKDISIIVDEVFDILRSEILDTRDIKITGFGSFETKLRGKKLGRNPKTGEEKLIEPRTVVVFKPSQLFKDYINK